MTNYAKEKTTITVTYKETWYMYKFNGDMGYAESTSSHDRNEPITIRVIFTILSEVG